MKPADVPAGSPATRSGDGLSCKTNADPASRLATDPNRGEYHRRRFIDIEDTRDGIDEIARRANSRYTAASRDRYWFRNLAPSLGHMCRASLEQP